MANGRVRKVAEVSQPSRVRKTVVLSKEAIRRLGAASVAESLDESEIVEMLINERLSGYVVQVRGPRLTRPDDRLTLVAEVDSPAPVAASAA